MTNLNQSSSRNILIKNQTQWNSLMRELEQSQVKWGGNVPISQGTPKYADHGSDTVITVEGDKVTYGRVENLAYPSLKFTDDNVTLVG
ncbi:hypothetical protein QS460_04400 [Liquorilactobacillus mali]|uniref:hypothetical protein n=1 Tax=Liquorilactobacillus mali TaxID=1618 RepID=UPI0026564C97|nr:hypothetical protein [Liquorilactobacillus mali]MDN7145166.1 hypothetical protein [Liquorilactobacillus mali]